MSNITLEGIARVVKVELEPLNTKLSDAQETLAHHTKTLDAHTKALDTLLSVRKKKSDENTVSSERFYVLKIGLWKLGESLV